MGGGALVLYGVMQNEQADDQCDGTVCHPNSESSIENAQKAGDGATIAFSVAGGLFGVGLGFLIADTAHRRKFRAKNGARSASAPGASVGLYARPGGLSLRGAF
jgi:hypothetical protein